MKIVQFIPNLNSGGAERFVVDLSNELSTNHEVYLFTLFDLDKHGFYKSEINTNIKVISFNKKLGVDLVIPYRILKELLRIKPDVVHSHLNAIFYLILSFWFLKKTVFFHTIHNQATKEVNSKFEFYYKYFLYKKKIVSPITISDTSTKGFEAFYNLSSHKIYNGRLLNYKVEYLKESFLNGFKKNNSTKVFVNVARLSEQKNQIMLVQAFKKLSDNGYDVSLIIVGNDDNTKIREEILSINKDVHILGQVKNPLDYMANADAFCLSSDYEGMPISLIECFGVGTIPICTPVGGIKDMIVDGSNGFLSSDKNLDSYYKTLEEFMNLNKDDIKKIKSKSKETFKKYSMDNCGAEHILLYQNILLKK